jgi:methionyl-tRNA synthetase
VKNTESWETNRDKSRKPRNKGFYCDKCDRGKPSGGSKCPVCGYKTTKKRFKKQKSYFLERD